MQRTRNKIPIATGHIIQPLEYPASIGNVAYPILFTSK
jgi:hypothetical protein